MIIQNCCEVDLCWKKPILNIQLKWIEPIYTGCVAWKWKITKGGFSAFCSSNIHFIPEQRSARNFHHFFEKIYNSRRSATRSARKGLTSASSPPPGKEGHNSSRPCCWYKFKLCPLVVFSHFAVLIWGVLLWIRDIPLIHALCTHKVKWDHLSSCLAQ